MSQRSQWFDSKRKRNTFDYNLQTILTFKVGIHIILLTFRQNSYNSTCRFLVNQYTFIRLSYSSCIPPAGSLMVTDTCHILTHPELLLLADRVSPCQVKTLSAHLFCTCLSALCPQGLQHVSCLHYIIHPCHAFSSISLSPSILSSR